PSPHTSRVSELDIDHPHCTNAGLKALADSSCWPNLKRLGLTDGTWGGKYTHTGVLRVLNSKRLPKLCELNLSGTQPPGFEKAAFYQNEGLQRLQLLWRGRDVAMKHFAACRHFTNLEEFSVADGTFTDADARTLLDNLAFAKLRKLTLYNVNYRSAKLPKATE